MLWTLLVAFPFGPLVADEADDIFNVPIFADSDPVSQDYGEGISSLSYGLEARPWLRKVLKILVKQRPPSFELSLSVVIKNYSSEEEYLLIEWVCQSCDFGKQLEIHKVFEKPEGGNGIKFLRQWKMHRTTFLSFVEPTGLPLHPTGAPLIVVYEGSGGSGADGYSLTLIEARRNTVDMTPDWPGRVVAVRDIDGDNVLEIIGIDDRRFGLFDTRGSAGPHVPIVWVWVDGRPEPVCSSHKPLFDAYIKKIQMYLQEQPHIPAPLHLELLAELTLASAQSGMLDRAFGFMSELDKKFQENDWSASPYTDHYIQIVNSISASLSNAQNVKGHDCVMSLIDG